MLLKLFFHKMAGFIEQGTALFISKQIFGIGVLKLQRLNECFFQIISIYSNILSN